MPSEEAMKEAKALVDNFDGARQMEGEVAIATAIDAAYARGRASNAEPSMASTMAAVRQYPLKQIIEERDAASVKALDAARAAGRAEGLEEARDVVKEHAGKYQHPPDVWGELIIAADAIDALATATQAGDSPAAPK